MSRDSEGFHVPVMPREVVERIVTDANGIYVDATVGGGGHAESILSGLSRGRLIGIDRDPEAIAASRLKLERFENRVVLFQTEFWNLSKVLKSNRIDAIDGILFDLGVSSHQIDTRERGFSYRGDGPLNMRMSPNIGLTAEDVLNSFRLEDLVRIFREYGQERYAGKIAQMVCKERKLKRIESTPDLREIVRSVLPTPRHVHKTLARVFQAIRIEINQELANLESSLRTAIDLLKTKRRIVVISYHSLEDRIAKSLFKEYVQGCVCPPGVPICACGRKRTLKLVDRKAIFPSALEVEKNPRAKSARLRAAEKLKIDS